MRASIYQLQGYNLEDKDKKNLATTYSPTDELQYHRRGSVLLTCSGWERVFPLRYGHQEDSPSSGTCSQWGQSVSEPKRQYGQASRLISTGRLNASLHLHLRPINQVVCLVPSVDSRSKGFLILRRASHLDAFSGYPFRT